MEEQFFLELLEGAVKNFGQEILPLTVFFPFLGHGAHKLCQTPLVHRQFQQGKRVPVAGKEQVEEGQLPDFSSLPAALKKS